MAQGREAFRLLGFLFGLIRISLFNESEWAYAFFLAGVFVMVQTGTKQAQEQREELNSTAVRHRLTTDIVTSICTAVLAITAVAALGFTYVQVNDFRESQRIERLVSEVHQYDAPDFIKIRQALASKRLDNKNSLRPLSVPDAPPEMYRVLDFFEHVAILQDRKALSVEDVWEEFGYDMSNIYADAKPVIDDAQQSDTTYYAHFSLLVSELNKIEKRVHPDASPIPTQSDIQDFYQSEKDLSVGVPAKRRHK